MLILGREDLASLLTPGDVIAAVERAFRECAAGRVAALPRAGLPMGRDGVFLAMISALPALGALGTKLATVVEGNRTRGLPTIQATYLLTDPATGTPLALMEAAFLTAIRTGATSAVAARYMARRAARARTGEPMGVRGIGNGAGIRANRAGCEHLDSQPSVARL